MGWVWARTGYETMFLFAGIIFLPVVIAALMLAEGGYHSQSLSPEPVGSADALISKPPARLKVDLGKRWMIYPGQF